jgi:hypothetical protein
VQSKGNTTFSIKNREINSKTQITQTFLIIFSLLLPATIALIANIQSYYEKLSATWVITTLLFFFVFFTLLYYRCFTPIENINVKPVKLFGILASMSLSFTISFIMILLLTLNNQVVHDLPFLIYLLAGTFLTIIISPLLLFEENGRQ